MRGRRSSLVGGRKEKSIHHKGTKVTKGEMLRKKLLGVELNQP
jgi:hypothetical protein